MKLPQIIMAIGALTSALCFSGCATITKSDSQPVAFSSDPQGAIISINGVPRGTTPVTIMMEKHFGDQMVTFQKDGFRTEQFKLQKHVAGMTFGNIIFGGIIGVGVDVATGKGMNYQDSVQVKLVPLAPTESGNPAAKQNDSKPAIADKPAESGKVATPSHPAEKSDGK